MGWQTGETGHWHGYGPWAGNQADYFGSHIENTFRRPDGSGFMESRVPPVSTGHWLLRRRQAKADQTWRDPESALKWLERMYESRPPKAGYASLDVKLAYARDALPRGVDVVFAYWTEGGSFFSMQVVCCPNHFHREIPCPLPPS